MSGVKPAFGSTKGKGKRARVLRQKRRAEIPFDRAADRALRANAAARVEDTIDPEITQRYGGRAPRVTAWRREDDEKKAG